MWAASFIWLWNNYPIITQHDIYSVIAKEWLTSLNSSCGTKPCSLASCVVESALISTWFSNLGSEGPGLRGIDRKRYVNHTLYAHTRSQLKYYTACVYNRQFPQVIVNPTWSSAKLSSQSYSLSCYRCLSFNITPFTSMKPGKFYIGKLSLFSSWPHAPLPAYLANNQLCLENLSVSVNSHSNLFFMSNRAMVSG